MAPATDARSALARLRPAGVVVVLALIFLLPWIGVNAYWTREIILVAILALVVSGLNVSLGFAGELAVGQVALYASGAYVAGFLAVHHHVTDIVVALAAAIVGVVIIGLVTGIPGLRLGGWSLAMVTFFLVLLIPYVLDLLKKQTGGSEGLTAIPLPTLFGLTLNGRDFYLFVVGVTILWFAILRNLIKSPHGNALLVLKQSPILASSLGISVYRLKLFAYVVGAIAAGIAGVLFAFFSGYLAPDSFTFSLAIEVLTASIIGGSQSIYGAIFGAALLQIVPERIGSFQSWSLVVYGGFLVLAGLLFADGAVGFARRGLVVARRRGWLGERALPAAIAGSEGFEAGALDPLSGAVLSLVGVSKDFGGLAALTDVTLDAQPGQVTAIIGPNGSGKTTLLNLICGYYRPTAGQIRLGEESIEHRSADRTARAGVARTFQTPQIPKGLTTRAFVACGAYATDRIGVAASVLRLPSFRRRTRDQDAHAVNLLQLLGIGHAADAAVSSLPLGTRRLVEVARCLASSPKVFLFDEVGSGLDGDDLQRLEGAIDMIRRAGGTVVLVEHNFPLVLKVADRIHVLSNGGLLATGTPAEIQSNTRVLEEYTGSRASGEALAEVGPSDDGSGVTS
jgi:branched-chain amino acid transport system permease protein